MLRINRWTCVAVGLLLAGTGFAQAPAGAPAGATGLCKDGSAWTGATKKGACKGHKGVKEWYGAPETSAPTTAPAAPAKTAAVAAPVAAAETVPAAATKSVKTSTAMPTTAAPGGGQ
ncbi:MAG: hypothetical protein ACREU6_01365 [Steroidobacteraceae bacterium]